MRGVLPLIRRCAAAPVAFAGALGQVALRLWRWARVTPARARVWHYLRRRGVALRWRDLHIDGRVRLRIRSSAHVTIDPPVTLDNCEILVGPEARFHLGPRCIIRRATIAVGSAARLDAGADVLWEGDSRHECRLDVSDGRAAIGDATNLRGRLLVRHGGSLTIGSHTFLNAGSEVRCDVAVRIGSFTWVSYDAAIFDTNSHSTAWRDRHSAIVRGAPHDLGPEPRPVCAPVQIGDDCWIGQRAGIVKGVTIADRSIVACQALVTHDVPAEHMAYGNPARTRPLRTPTAEARPQRESAAYIAADTARRFHE